MRVEGRVWPITSGALDRPVDDMYVTLGVYVRGCRVVNWTRPHLWLCMSVSWRFWRCRDGCTHCYRVAVLALNSRETLQQDFRTRLPYEYREHTRS